MIHGSNLPIIMQVILSCIGKFHHFDLARELESAGCFQSIYTGYPRWKLKDEGLPDAKVHTHPLWQTLYMAQGRFRVESRVLSAWLAKRAAFSHDAYVAQNLDGCDVFVGLSGHNYRAGLRAKALGARWVCDRGSSHIVFQDQILREEHRRWKVPFSGVPQWALEQEQAEYAACDLITVPSRFAERTFVEAGVSTQKLRRVAYGVDLTKFHSVGRPREGHFDVVFVGGVGVRKGVPYLIEAFGKLRHPKKSLTIIGGIDPAFASWVRGCRAEGVSFLGSRPQAELKEHLSRSHLFVLASIEEGLALVQAQALACGCPVLCTENTGGDDLITSGVEGYVVQARNADALAERMQQLVDQPDRRDAMGVAALKRVNAIGGWDEYGRNYRLTLENLVSGETGN